MKIVLTSKVKREYTEVFKRFDRDLFLFLLPPGAELIEFGGSHKGDRVEILFKFPLKGRWVSDITEHGELNDQYYFIDVGTVLPFGLKTWHHRHIVEKAGENSARIIDQMEFSTGNKFLDLIYYPGLYMAFLPRVFQYKKYFNK